MQALVNVGCDLAKLVPGRVSTEIDARLAYDTNGIISKVWILRLMRNVPTNVFLSASLFYMLTYSFVQEL